MNNYRVTFKRDEIQVLSFKYMVHIENDANEALFLFESVWLAEDFIEFFKAISKERDFNWYSFKREFNNQL